jgi:hypothetical protein
MQCIASSAGIIFRSGGASDPVSFETNSTSRMVIGASGGLTIGSPTGGNKGDGTLNATAVYDDDVLLTCFGVEYLINGGVDIDKWDSYSPTGRNALVHRFVDMIGTGFDPRSPDSYISKMYADRALPGMPTETEWRHNTLSLGDMHNHMWLATELVASFAVGIYEQLMALRGRIESIDDHMKTKGRAA